ncbi:DUF4279 domain-containing protein [Neisseria yangbaofengii]|uniref:DUF4279 domain-containing protein n=1 Tax=Neisseria yangbaofengii TaxID=2709396 RepID=UPI0013E9E669|nr:DUF4279 domain-containing protein [Neisseria yangbaofengii]
MENNSTLVNVDFSLIGDTFDTEYVTEYLGVNPSETLKKGELKNWKKIPNIETIWSVQTGFEESFDINSQLSKIKTLFIKKTQQLNYLIEVLNLKIAVSITILIKDNEVPAIYLEEEVLKFLSDIKAVVDIDIDM